jgi:hypothetical protein
MHAIVAGYYSFATCGYLDTYTSTLKQAFELRAVIIGNSGGWLGTYCDTVGEVRSTTLPLTLRLPDIRPGHMRGPDP